MKVAFRNILTVLCVFVVALLIIMFNGDFGELAVIEKAVGFLLLLFAMLWLFVQLVLLNIASIIMVAIGICCLISK